MSRFLNTHNYLRTLKSNLKRVYVDPRFQAFERNIKILVFSIIRTYKSIYEFCLANRSDALGK